MLAAIPSIPREYMLVGAIIVQRVVANSDNAVVCVSALVGAILACVVSGHQRSRVSSPQRMASPRAACPLIGLKEEEGCLQDSCSICLDWEAIGATSKATCCGAVFHTSC